MEMEMTKVDDPMVTNVWIVKTFHFHFLFPHQILDLNTALMLSASDSYRTNDHLVLLAMKSEHRV